MTRHIIVTALCILLGTASGCCTHRHTSAAVSAMANTALASQKEYVNLAGRPLLAEYEEAASKYPLLATYLELLETGLAISGPVAAAPRSVYCHEVLFLTAPGIATWKIMCREAILDPADILCYQDYFRCQARQLGSCRQKLLECIGGH